MGGKNQELDALHVRSYLCPACDISDIYVPRSLFSVILKDFGMAHYSEYKILSAVVIIMQ